jgi:hypothetical protein
MLSDVVMEELSTTTTAPDDVVTPPSIGTDNVSSATEDTTMTSPVVEGTTEVWSEAIQYSPR